MCEDGFFCFNSRDSGMQSIEIKNIDTFRYKTFIYSRRELRNQLSVSVIPSGTLYTESAVVIEEAD
ncbi:hypothetical protein ABD86_03490 [Paenibacillus alvei]|nr:hypothetical protein [Paenibacillus alvei]MBG9743031.1 hypothetical protein [Paenibacillus alvei]